MVLFNRFPLAPLDGTGFDTLFRTAEGMAGRALRAPISPVAGVDTARAELEPTEDGARLTLMAPGFGPEHVEITVKRDRVRIKGERTDERAQSFERSFRVPFPVDAEAAFANVEHGVIAVSLPRHAADQPRSIRVDGAAPAIEADVQDEEA